MPSQKGDTAGAESSLTGTDLHRQRPGSMGKITPPNCTLNLLFPDSLHPTPQITRRTPILCRPVRWLTRHHPTRNLTPILHPFGQPSQPQSNTRSIKRSLGGRVHLHCWAGPGPDQLVCFMSLPLRRLCAAMPPARTCPTGTAATETRAVPRPEPPANWHQFSGCRRRALARLLMRLLARRR